MCTPLETEKILAVAAALYPNFKMQVTPAQFAGAWHRHVGHLSAEQLQAAIDRAVAGTQFYPTVHDVLDAHAQMMAGEPRTGLEAWADLLAAVKLHSRNDPPAIGGKWEFEDPTTTEAALALGWAAFCMSDEDSLRWPFAKIYDALAGRKKAEHMRLPGAPNYAQLVRDSSHE